MGELLKKGQYMKFKQLLVIPTIWYKFINDEDLVRFIAWFLYHNDFELTAIYNDYDNLVIILEVISINDPIIFIGY